MNIVIENEIDDFPFSKMRNNIYSQCGEDGILAYLLGMVSKEKGYFVEFGAWDGKHLSNCAALVERGWSGCFIEGDKERFKDLLERHSSNKNLDLVNAYVASSGEFSLDKILSNVNAPKDFDVLSIDIDGNDYHVWNGLLEHRPLICIVEYNPTIPAQVEYVQEDDPNVNFGNSLAAFAKLAKNKGYKLVAATELNGFFMLSDVCSEKNVPVYSVEQVKSRTYETYIFHGYDGRMEISGMKSLLWHGVNFKVGEMQVLPDALIKFPEGQSPEYYKGLHELREKNKEN